MPANEAVNLSCQSLNINGGQWDVLGRMLAGGSGAPVHWMYMEDGRLPDARANGNL